LPAEIRRLLDRLDEAKRRLKPGDLEQAEKLVARLANEKFKDAGNLIRFHEILLFLRAYPHNRRVLRIVEQQLLTFSQRFDLLENSGADVSVFETPEVSGVAGTAVTDTFSYNIVRWLLKKHPRQVNLDWYWFEDENRLAATWPRFMPLLEEDAFVEANVPYVKWLHSAKQRGRTDLGWLIQQFGSLPLSENQKAELYDSLKLYVRWRPSYRATRTGMKLPVRKVFYHRRPLLQRRDFSFSDELQAPSPDLQLLPAKQGEAILNMARETSTLRYRELYGFTHGDPGRVLRARVGRGVDLFVVGLPAERRLPLRAYHAAMIFKNGVPLGYFEGLSLFERMESGFNLYYSFREGETAWIYAQTLRVFHLHLGVTTFSIDPYQLGHENEEGIESGAFWFYRKLGFRPTQPSILERTLEEERKLSQSHSYRTSARLLRQLAAGPMIFEMSPAQSADWYRFEVRNIGLALQRRMAAEFKGEAKIIREESVKTVARALGVRITEWKEAQLDSFSNVAMVLMLIRDLDRWSKSKKLALVQIIRAKAGADEGRYLKLMQQHARLRAAMIQLGTSGK
jgi:hypothetical protein